MVSRSDQAAHWTGVLKGHAFFAYATNSLIGLDHAVIVDVETILKLDRLRLRGSNGARGEFRLPTAARNLGTPAKLLPTGSQLRLA